jgi:hypothetical protein
MRSIIIIRQNSGAGLFASGMPQGAAKRGPMKRTTLLLIAFFLACASLALAHDTKKHILGTVVKVSADSIVVEAKNGKTIEVAIVPATVFQKDGKPAKLQDLTLGDRVVVHATPKGLALEADEVRFATVPPKAKPKS